MTDPKEERELTPEELEAQEGEELPDREAMTLLGGPVLGHPADSILPIVE
jgi:hypothetical protein